LSLTKKKGRERDESTTRKPCASLAVAASVAYAPPVRVPAQKIRSTHLGQRSVRLVWSEMSGNLLRTNTLQQGEGKMGGCSNYATINQGDDDEDDDNDGDGTTGNGAMGYNDDDNGDG